MRTITSAVAIAVLGTALSGAAYAGSPYTASVDACQSAISTRLGLDNVPASYDVKKVRSLSHHRDLTFVVSSQDAARTIHDLKVACRTKDTGEVLALTLDESAVPVAVVTQ